MKHFLSLLALCAFIALSPITAEAQSDWQSDYLKKYDNDISDYSDHSDPFKKRTKKDCTHFCEEKTPKEDKYKYEKPKMKSTYDDALHKNRGKPSSMSDIVLDGLKPR